MMKPIRPKTKKYSNCGKQWGSPRKEKKVYMLRFFFKLIVILSQVLGFATGDFSNLFPGKVYSSPISSHLHNNSYKFLHAVRTWFYIFECPGWNL